jgi:septum formation protein
MKKMQRQIILASTSPRRKQLLKLLNIAFKAVDSGYEEIVNLKLSHRDLVKCLAVGKAHSAAKKYPKAIIVAADTMVSFRGKIIGKPKNRQEAEKMLKSFSGKAQEVITGFAVLDAKTKQVIAGGDKIKIYFKKLSSRDISAYIKSGEPFDKAGGYNLQGLGFNLIEKIEGDFTCALGLPMTAVFNALEKLGVKI